MKPPKPKAQSPASGGGVIFSDPHMQTLRALHGPAPFHPNPVKIQPAFRTLVSSIVGQQLSGKAAETIWRRLEARFPLQPEVLGVAEGQELQALGLSKAKAAYIRDLSHFALRGGLEGLEGLPDGEIVARLIQVKGIGVWTAQMYLMFGLGRPDVWPILDLGVRKGAERLYGPLDRQGLEALGERFQPHRSHAAWYLWRVLETP
ncbi:DNA-3-methyladenine glycosylase family protein [Meiothermus granaticius]|uniref:DNA-3-methyladenine glycosylase II n=1 Tax=Meiothermus granaticius NBRC 107808 TaxID=1227551 RepID=A0A399F9V6_9DEIN|nr:putative bifunctional transcriptional activator/DNA repair enzyme AlkA [Meiothermus granaticius NBRC 107808]